MLITTREQAGATRRKHIKMTTLDHAPEVRDFTTRFSCLLKHQNHTFEKEI